MAVPIIRTQYVTQTNAVIEPKRVWLGAILDDTGGNVWGYVNFQYRKKGDSVWLSTSSATHADGLYPVGVLGTGRWTINITVGDTLAGQPTEWRARVQYPELKTYETYGSIIEIQLVPFVKITRPTSGATWSGTESMQWTLYGTEHGSLTWEVRYKDGITWRAWNKTTGVWQTPPLSVEADRLSKGTRSLSINTQYPGFNPNTNTGEVEIIYYISSPPSPPSPPFIPSYTGGWTGIHYIIVKNAPVVQTTSPSLVKDITGTLNGNLSSLGGFASVDCHFKYKKSTEPSWTSTAVQVKTSTGAYSQALTGLEKGVTYQFKAYAEYTGGWTEGSVLTFTTIKVSTHSVSNLTYQSARLNGLLDGMGSYSPFSLYFKWREKGVGGWITTGSISRSYVGDFHIDISGLTPNKTYEYQAFGDYAGGTAAGSILEFNTMQKTPPSVSTDNAIPVEVDEYKLEGILISLGDYTPVNVFFRWRKKVESVWTETTPASKTSAGRFNSNVGGLVGGTTYEFKAVVEYDSSEVEGVVLEFTVSGVGLVTLDATEVLDTTVILNGEITTLGEEETARVLFRYREYGVTEWTETAEQTVTFPVVFSQALSNLTPGRTYYFKAVAKYALQEITIEGVVKQFSTVVGMRRVFIRPDNCKAGDIFYHDGMKLVRLPAGTPGQRLRIGVEGVPKWV